MAKRAHAGLRSLGRLTTPMSSVSPSARLGRAVALLPDSARGALRDVADREDLPLVAGVWGADGAGCLVANVIATMAADADAHGTLDVRVLELIPELSSRDLNRLIVAWDEAAFAAGADSDAELRALLRAALVDAATRDEAVAASSAST